MSEPLNGLKSQVQSAPFSFEMVRVELLPPDEAAPPVGELDEQAASAPASVTAASTAPALRSLIALALRVSAGCA